MRCMFICELFIDVSYCFEENMGFTNLNTFILDSALKTTGK